MSNTITKYLYEYFQNNKIMSNTLIKYLYDEYFQNNKIKVILGLYLDSLVCHFTRSAIYHFVVKPTNVQFKKHDSYHTVNYVIDSVIITPFIEEIWFRLGISLSRWFEEKEKNENEIYWSTIIYKIFSYGYSLIVFPYMHINNFNSREIDKNTSILVIMLYYGVPATYLTYCTHKYSLARSIIFHAFVNMNVRLISI